MDRRDVRACRRQHDLLADSRAVRPRGSTWRHSARIRHGRPREPRGRSRSPDRACGRSHSDWPRPSEHRSGSRDSRDRRAYGAWRRLDRRRQGPRCEPRSKASRRRGTPPCIRACRTHTSRTRNAGRWSFSMSTALVSSVVAAFPARPDTSSLSPDGQTLWTVLGTDAARVAVLDTSNGRRPKLVRTFAASVSGTRRRHLPRRASRLGHLGLRATDRRLPQRTPGARARRRYRPAARRVRT